jgi:dethiobiotin synthetase
MRLIVTATDTDVGKTVFAAALAGALDGFYWKPFQAGLGAPTDSERVRALSGLAADRVLPEAYALRTPASIHRAAEIDGVVIDPSKLEIPDVDKLVIEGAGGALVPVSRQLLLADLFAQWNLPVIVVARTSLGTINHSLLTIEGLRSRGLRIHGMAFVGDANEYSERTICEIGQARRLGRLPRLEPLERASLARAFSENFKIEDYR